MAIFRRRVARCSCCSCSVLPCSGAANGQPVAQIDLPPVGRSGPAAVWLPNELLDRLQPLPVPANLPAGRYWLALTLYDPKTLQRLPLRGPTPSSGAPPAGADELIIGPLDIR